MSQYEASGGMSRLFRTEDEQYLRVEAHPRDFALLWSSSLAAEVVFQRVMNWLPEEGEALLRREEQVIEMGTRDVIRLMTRSQSWDFIRFDFRDRVFTWEAAPESRWPPALPEVGILVEGVDDSYFVKLIRETATAGIAENAEALLSEAADVISRFPTVSLRPMMDAGA